MGVGGEEGGVAGRTCGMCLDAGRVVYANKGSALGLEAM